jgi:CDP-diacylglycerol--glycerol-3-phosphate 3-phosphatidyltransferase
MSRLNSGLTVPLAVVATCLLSMAVYVFRGARRDPGHDAKGTHMFFGWGDFLLHWMIWLLEPLTRLSMRLGATPNHHTYLAFALGLASGALIGAGHLQLGGWTFALSGVIDTLDGQLARKTGLISTRGDFLDGTLDRFVDVCVFLGLLVYLRETRWGPLVTAAAMGGSLIVSYTRARGEVQGVVCTGGLMQRPERVLLISVVCILDSGLSAWRGWPTGTFVLWSVAIVAVMTLITAVHRTIWIAARLS